MTRPDWTHILTANPPYDELLSRLVPARVHHDIQNTNAGKRKPPAKKTWREAFHTCLAWTRGRVALRALWWS
jgi:hypothetical protein